MVFGQMQWSAIRNTGGRRRRRRNTNCCALTWSSQRYKKQKGGTTVRHAEVQSDEKEFVVDMLIIEMDGDTPATNAVVFMENSNFSSPFSLKLKVNGTYTILLAVDPSLELKSFKLKDHRFKLSDDGLEIADDGKKVYKYLWSVGDVPKTKNSKRFILSGTLKVEGQKKLKFDMLVKFYKDGERRVYDGDKLASIGLEFIVPKDPGAHHHHDGDESDAEDEPESKFNVVNNIVFKEMEEEEEDED